jgi:two-component system response regulator FixJ
MISIVDNDSSARASTTALLEGEGYRVKAFESGGAFLAGRSPAGDDGSDCVVLDLHLPGLSGIGVLTTLNNQESMPPVLVLTRQGGIAEAVQAMKLGATDFFEKPYEADFLLRAISLALTSGPRRKKAAIDSEAAALLSSLSRRQLDVLKGILRGQQNKIIAYELSLSIRTVETYRAQVLVKLGVRGTADAVRLAIAAGMLDSI